MLFLEYTCVHVRVWDVKYEQRDEGLVAGCVGGCLARKI